MLSKTCCFTGHRHLPKSIYKPLELHLKQEIENLISKGVFCFGSGGAIGFDTVAAFAVLDLKKKYPHLKLILVLPCKDQSKKWDRCQRSHFNDILKKADKVVYISEYYDKNCLFKRNRHLIDNSNFCLCYCNKE